jgi:hypothetical protein
VIVRWSPFIAIALGSLLALATSASAECAWVLWGRLMQPPTQSPMTFTPLSAWTGKADCEKERARPEIPPAVLLCLPDTVDPRGPKGK